MDSIGSLVLVVFLMCYWLVISILGIKGILSNKMCCVLVFIGLFILLIGICIFARS